MASPEKQIEFLSNLQRLLAEGSFVSTYKYALLLSLADLCVELGRDDDSPLVIPTRRIGEKFAEYYWRQCAPYLPAGGEDAGVLKQNTGESPKIIKVLQKARGAYDDSLVNLRRDERVWKRTLTQVSAQVRKMPLWKLQTVGTQKLDFLYGNSGGGISITLKPGVGFCFRKHYPLVVDLVKGAWAQYVRRYNADRLAEKADLHEFLFGSERANLAVVRPILEHFQAGLCFYCHRPIREEAGHVDHFVPWSRYPVDLGHNFVLAHASCNERKSDRLPAAPHLNAWVAPDVWSDVLGRQTIHRGHGVVLDANRCAKPPCGDGDQVPEQGHAISEQRGRGGRSRTATVLGRPPRFQRIRLQFHARKYAPGGWTNAGVSLNENDQENQENFCEWV